MGCGCTYRVRLGQLDALAWSPPGRFAKFFSVGHPIYPSSFKGWRGLAAYCHITTLRGVKRRYLASQMGRVSLVRPRRIRGLGQVAAAAALANEVQGYESGATGKDALAGAETGESIGTMVLPGIGTAVGAVIGGVVGAVSSLFGGGSPDPETMAFQNYVPKFNANPAIAAELTPAQNFQLLAGMFDASCDSPNHATPLEQHWGRMAEGAFVNDLFSQINSAIQSGSVASDADAVTLYTDVIDPYLTSITGKFGCCTTCQIESTWTDVNGNHFGNAIIAAIVYLTYQWQAGLVSQSTPLGICGQEDTKIPTYIGTWDKTTPPPATTVATTTSTAPVVVTAPAQPAAPATPSPNGTTINAPSGSLITSQGTWTFGATPTAGDYPILLNGSVAGGGAGTELTIQDGQLIAFNATGDAYSWNGTLWSPLSTSCTKSIPASAPAASPVTANLSANGTSITPASGGSLTIATGVITFGETACDGNSDILLNGSSMGGGYGTEVAILDGTPVTSHADGSTWDYTGSTWSELTPATSSAPVSSAVSSPVPKSMLCPVTSVSPTTSAPVSAAAATPVSNSGGISASTLLIVATVLGAAWLLSQGKSR